MSALRVVCYLNQFFGQIGGEDKAGVGPQVFPGAVGAARAVQQALGDAGRVVATVVAGDNYVAERADAAVAEMLDLDRRREAGSPRRGPRLPGGALRRGVRRLCGAVQDRLGLPAVTGMHQENPGVELYRRRVYIVSTGTDAARMLDEVRRLVALGLKLARREPVGAPAVEGYFPRGITRNTLAGATAAQRATAMLLDKLAGRPVTSEVPLPDFPASRPLRPCGISATRSSPSSPTAGSSRSAIPIGSRPSPPRASARTASRAEGARPRAVRQRPSRL